MMKLNNIALVFLIFLFFAFLACQPSDAHFLAAEEQVEEKVNHGEIIQEDQSFIGIRDDLSDLMGSGEGCDEEDAECLKRRMIAEAHLDYIYTQHHKP